MISEINGQRILPEGLGAPKTNQQQAQQPVTVAPPTPPPELPKDKTDIKTSILAEVKAEMEKMVASIKNYVMGVNLDFNAIRDEVRNLYFKVNSKDTNSSILDEKQIREIARKEIPACLRDLDASGSQRQGNVLMLQSGQASGQDSSYWGTVKTGTGLDLSDKVFFGVKCNPASNDPDLVRIYAGEIDGITVSQTDITVADNNFVYVRRTNANNTMTILASASVPADDATYRYYKLHQFSVTDGVAKVLKYCRPFAIEGMIIPDNKDALQYQGIYLTANGNTMNNNPSLNAWDFLRWA